MPTMVKLLVRRILALKSSSKQVCKKLCGTVFDITKRSYCLKSVKSVFILIFSLR